MSPGSSRPRPPTWLGDELLGSGLGVTPEDRDRRARFGRRWIDQWVEEHRDLICTDVRVVAFLEDAETSTSVQEAALVFDVIAPLLKSAPPLATVSVILARRGLTRLCSAPDRGSEG